MTDLKVFDHCIRAGPAYEDTVDNKKHHACGHIIRLSLFLCFLDICLWRVLAVLIDELLLVGWLYHVGKRYVNVLLMKL